VTLSISSLFLTVFLVVGNAAAWAGGRDEKIINEHPDLSWARTVGGLFTSGKSVAVVIGISDYRGTESGGYPKLRTSANDPGKMVQFLKDDAGFDIIYVLTEEKATKERVEQLMIDEVRLTVGPHDRFLFYWSGHGDQLLVGERKHGFLPLASSKLNEFSGMVSMGDIARWDTYLSAQQALFVLDSCLSGLAGTEEKGPRDKRMQQLSQSGHHLVTAGEAGENVISGERWSGSLFTDSFIKGAKGEASALDGLVSLWSLLDYIQSRVAIEREAVRWEKSLTPQIRFLTAGPGAFFFAAGSPRSSGEVASRAESHDARSETKGDSDAVGTTVSSVAPEGNRALPEQRPRSAPLIDQLADNIDFNNAVTNRDAISSLVGIAGTQGDKERDIIVAVLKQKLQRPSSKSYDSLGRAVRKALLEGIIKIRHHDIRNDFLDGQLVDIDLVGADLSNVKAPGVKFSNAFLLGDGFQGADLRGVDFSSTSLRNAHFDNAQLDSAVFSGADWFNAGGLTVAQMKAASPKGLIPCPTTAKGKYSKSTFIKYANDHYGVAFESWADEEQSDAAKFWGEYGRPNGLCDIVKLRH
jgi:hypothetical protein